MTTKRERYERANMRGGLGVRKRLSDESLKETYRINGVQTGSVVIRAHDKYFGDMTKGFDVGILVRRTASTVFIHWAGDEDFTTYGQGDARYEVDRGRWRFLGVMGPNPLDPDDPISVALTSLRQAIKVPASADADDPPETTDSSDETEGDDEVAREKSNAAAEREAAQRAVQNGSLSERETYTAKQVAIRCGTDSKTMRKFFRSSNSTVEPVGQGGRYEFDARDLPKIKREFEGWRSKADSRKPTPKPIDQVHTEAEIAEAKADAKEHDGNAARRQREAKAKPKHTTEQVEEAFRNSEHFDPDSEPTQEDLDEMAAILDSGLGHDLLDLDD